MGIGLSSKSLSEYPEYEDPLIEEIGANLLHFSRVETSLVTNPFSVFSCEENILKKE